MKKRRVQGVRVRITRLCREPARGAHLQLHTSLFTPGSRRRFAPPTPPPRPP